MSGDTLLCSIEGTQDMFQCIAAVTPLVEAAGCWCGTVGGMLLRGVESWSAMLLFVTAVAPFFRSVSISRD